METDAVEALRLLDAWLDGLEDVAYVRPGRDVLGAEEQTGSIRVVSAGGALRGLVGARLILVECGGHVEAFGDTMVLAIPNCSGEWPCQTDKPQANEPQANEPQAACECAAYGVGTPVLLALLRSPAAAQRGAGLLRLLSDAIGAEPGRGIDPQNAAALDYLTNTDWGDSDVKLALCLYPNP